MTAGLLLDAALALALPIVAWRVLASDELFQGVVLYVALGLLSALAWVRLDAPDIALVEAAVGAGLTGALLVETLAWLPADPTRPRRAPHRATLALALLAAIAGLGAALRLLPSTVPRPDALPGAEATGAANPVTAVLLNLRAHDTLLEVAVLLAAAVAARSLPARDPPRHRPDRAGPLLGALARTLLPALILVAGYLVWAGSHAPGGAFQAGATLAAGGILLTIAGRLSVPDSPAVRAVLVAGPVVFLAVAAATLLVGRPLLAYGDRAKSAILAIEWALVPSIALVLLLFFPARPGGSEERA